MDIRKVKKLIELLKESDVAELEIKEGEESVRISRLSTLAPAQAAAAPMVVSAPPAIDGGLRARAGDCRRQCRPGWAYRDLTHGRYLLCVTFPRCGSLRQRWFERGRGRHLVHHRGNENIESDRSRRRWCVEFGTGREW